LISAGLYKMWVELELAGTCIYKSKVSRNIETNKRLIAMFFILKYRFCSLNINHITPSTMLSRHLRSVASALTSTAPATSMPCSEFGVGVRSLATQATFQTKPYKLHK